MENQKISSIRAVLPKRQEDVKELSEKVSAFLINLKDINEDLFSNWYEQGWTRKDAKSNKVVFESEWLSKIITQEWDNKLPQLGASFTFWSGNEDDTQNAKISFRIGATSDKASINNFIGISLPFDDKLRLEKDDRKIEKIKYLLLKTFDALEIEAD